MNKSRPEAGGASHIDDQDEEDSEEDLRLRKALLTRRRGDAERRRDETCDAGKNRSFTSIFRMKRIGEKSAFVRARESEPDQWLLS